MYKTLRSNAQNFIETVITVQRVESQKFFCDILSLFITNWNALKHYDAQNTPNLTIIKYKIIFFSAFAIQKLERFKLYETSNFP